VAVAVTTLLVMAGSAVAALRGMRGATALMIVAFAVWLLVDEPLEGPVLLILTHSHGVHIGDIVALTGVVIVLMALGRRHVARRIRR
jgi:hypothetical protein